jgi:hypothetical protein
MIKILSINKVSRFAFVFLFLTLVWTKSAYPESEGLHDPKIKAQALCDKDPMNSKCKKFLDGKYRRHNDAEKIPKRDDEIPGTILDEKSYEGELKRELLSFCRKEPASSRCRSMKK